jgi:hypothetical protein
MQMDIKELKKAVQAALKGYNTKSYGRILKFSYPHLLQEIESHTQNHYPKNITESLYILFNGAPSVCANGNKPSFAGYQIGYRQFCGAHAKCECSRLNQAEKVKQWQHQVSPEQRDKMQAKTEATMLEKYGVTNPMHSEQIVAKIEATNLEKYGVRYSLEREDVQEKIKATMTERYGVDTPLKSPAIWKKTKETSISKYGGLMTHARQGAYDKYDGQNPFQVTEVKAKIDETNLTKYGATRPLANKDVLNKMYENNIKKHGRPNPAQFHYSSELWDILQDKTKFLDIVKNKSSVQVANEFDTRSDLILSYARRYGVLDQMNFQPRSAMEDDLCEWLSAQQIPFKRRDKKILQGLELDIVLPNYNLAIELNGLYQHSELAGKKDPKYHWHKTKGCDIKGLQLLHMWQDEYWTAKRILQSKILYLVKKIETKTHARQCMIRPINNAAQESAFMNTNHIQGFADYRQHSMAAWDGPTLVGVMSFAHRKGRLELVRYATDVNRVCVGLFSRLFYHSVTEFQFSGKIISQSDNRISNGALYLSTGWQYEGEQPPGYCYTGDYVSRQNKENFMKGKLAKKFGLDIKYVEANTEWQIMQDLGYDRLWDAGKKIWSKTV